MDEVNWMCSAYPLGTSGRKTHMYIKLKNITHFLRGTGIRLENVSAPETVANIYEMIFSK